MYQNKSNIQDMALLFIDFLCVLAGLILANIIRHGYAFEMPSANVRFAVLWGLCEGVFVITNLMFRMNKDFYTRGRLKELIMVLSNNLIIMAGVAFILYFLKLSAASSRMMLLLFVVINTVLMMLVHQLIKLMIPKLYPKLFDCIRMLLVVDREYVDNTVNDYRVSADFTRELIGLVIPDEPELTEYQGIPVVSDIGNLAEYCRTASLDEVIIAVDEHDRDHTELIKPVMEKLAQMGIIIHYRIDPPDLSDARHKMLVHMGSMYTITYASQVASVGQILIKRAMDIAGGVIGSILAILLFIIFGPIIKLQSPGPVIFKQKRVGRNGRVFNIYKFRSMYMDAEERKKELLEKNEMKGHMFKMDNDPRIIPIGRFMRRTSLDEFPQFYNILIGEMSLVGTRPPTLDEFKEYNYYHKKRLSFRPGLTGMWQVSGRNNISDFEDIVRLDVEYIDNWTLLLDIRILFKTLGVVFKGR